MKSKYIKLKSAIVAWLYFLILWLVFNYPYWLMDNENADLLDSLIYNSSRSDSGYFSIKYLFIFYIVPFLLFIPYFVHAENAEIVLKYKNRSQFYIARSLQILSAASIFSICIISINIIGNYMLEHAHFLEYNYGIISLFNIFSMICIYFWIGLLYYIILDFWGWRLAFFLTFFLCAILGFGMIYFGLKWTPAGDVNLMDFLIIRKITYTQSMVVIVREGMIAIIIFIIGLFLIDKKDFSLEQSK
ncbi:WxPxxD family membrane protein [Terrilactibacillus laevilacticus]|uniref:WxPxxD family membrane protein n=1 Tax=Terrilactibacillus laevilacticus TaxID=1380157 RepID=A0ABW5PME7_9BACI|nr:WxPxxD family membrane protein [Terrilactibacillus laevilacticus]